MHCPSLGEWGRGVGTAAGGGARSTGWRGGGFPSRRARRSEYWRAFIAWALVYFLLYLAIALTLPTGSDQNDASNLSPAALIVLGLTGLFLLATVVPLIAVMVRRLHDTGRSGWWYLIALVPFGGIVLLVFTVMDSEPDGGVCRAPQKPLLRACASGRTISLMRRVPDSQVHILNCECAHEADCRLRPIS